MLLWRILVLAFASLAAIPAAAQTADRPVLRLTNGEWEPYHGEKLPHHGVGTQIVTRAFALEGIAVDYGFFPWVRALALADAPDWDGSLLWVRSPERELRFHLSAPVFDTEYVLFHLKSRPLQWHGVADLAAYRLGVTSGYHYGTPFQQAMDSGVLRTEAVSEEEVNFAKLLRGRIDAFPMDRRRGYHVLATRFTPAQAAQVTHHSLPLQQQGMHLLLKRSDPRNAQRMDAFNRGLKKLKDSGELDALLRASPPAEPRP